METNTLEITPAKTISVSELGVIFSDDVTIEDWEIFGEQIGRVVNSSQFVIGDWINFGREKWDREEFKKRVGIAELKTGLEPATLRNYSSIARRVPMECRVKNCSYDIHRTVSNLDAKNQSRWLRIADEKGMTSRRLKASIKAGKPLTVEEFSTKKEATHSYDDCLVFVHNIERWFSRKNNTGFFDALDHDELSREVDKLQPVVDAYNSLMEKLNSIPVGNN